MRKIILFAAALMIACQSVCAAAENITYTADKSLISIRKTQAKANESVCVTINSNDLSIGADNKPVHMYIYKTDTNGSLDIDIPVTGDISSGKYYIYFDSAAGHSNDSLIILNPAAGNTKKAIEKINECAGSESKLYELLSDSDFALAVGLDTEDEHLSGNLKYICRYSSLEKNYDITEFVNMCDAALACADINAGKSADEVMKAGAELFGTSYEDYSKIKDKARDKLDELLSKADFTESGAEKTYAEQLFLAYIKTAEDSSEVTEKFIEYADEIGIKTSKGSDYAALGASALNKVKLKLFNSKDSINSFADAKSVFNNAVADNKKSGSGSGSGSGGGSGSTSKSDGSYIAPAKENPDTAAASKDFADMNGHWSEEYVNRLLKLKVVSGYEDNTFMPSKAVTRAEFVQMLTNLFGIKSEANIEFDDVAPGAWYESAVKNSAGAGLVYGSGGRFNPNDNITREDAAVIVYRLGRTAAGGEAAEFDDKAEISAYAVEAVEKLSSCGVISGDNNRFNPKKTLTRAEAAVLLCKAYDAEVK